MYEPAFNSVLVQIDDKDAAWGSGNDESMLGKSYSKGKVMRIGEIMDTAAYPVAVPFMKDERFKRLITGDQIMWNEGAEAGTTFEFDGQLFGMIYWYDIRGVLVSLTEAELNKQFEIADKAANE